MAPEVLYFSIDRNVKNYVGILCFWLSAT